MANLTDHVRLLRNADPSLRLDTAIDMTLGHLQVRSPDSLTQRLIQIPAENTPFWSQLRTQNHDSRTLPLWNLLRAVLLYAARAPGNFGF